MRVRIIGYLKTHPTVLRFAWFLVGCFIKIYGRIVHIQPKTMIFSSFGGRSYDDSPKALYDEICKRKEFDGWRLIWAFTEPEKIQIPRGEKVKIDTLAFFKAVLHSRVWISNSGMARGVSIKRKGVVYIQTWHGTPLKRIGGEENQGSIRKGHIRKRASGFEMIRCAQSEYDKKIFARVNNADEKEFVMSDLPRNDRLLEYRQDEVWHIKESLGIPLDKKIILYMPTYREFLIDKNNLTYLAPPMNIKKWENQLSDKYVLLIRAHYAVNKALELEESSFVKNVSDYQVLSDLYAIADIMISDYSSSYFDFAILDRPMFCFAYDLEEYENKRGLYVQLEDILPCSIDKDEDTLLKHIKTMNEEKMCVDTKRFHAKYAGHAGKASCIVIDELINKLKRTGEL